MTTILVTGAGRGIGLALVEIFAGRGDEVIATLRDPTASPRLAGLAAHAGGAVSVLPLEVTDPVSIAALARRLGGRPVDVLVNNAGILGPTHQSSLDMDFDGWLETLKVNTLAPLAVAQALLPNLRLGDRPRILTLSSGMGSMAFTSADHVAYRSSKAAVNKVMQCLANDLKAEGIAVAVCHPGWVRTAMGGEHAEIDAETSAAGIARIVDRMSPTRSPAFHVWDGSAIPW